MEPQSQEPGARGKAAAQRINDIVAEAKKHFPQEVATFMGEYGAMDFSLTSAAQALIRESEASGIPMFRELVADRLGKAFEFQANMMVLALRALLDKHDVTNAARKEGLHAIVALTVELPLDNLKHVITLDSEYGDFNTIFRSN